MTNQNSLKRSFTPSSDREFMQLAIEQMLKCEGNVPKVGAVVVKDNLVVAYGHRSQNVHAERVAIEKAQEKGINLKECAIYSTLEPCVPINKKSFESCAELILRVGISTVIIGCYDINPDIYRTGWKFLRDKGIRLRDFDLDFRNKIQEINANFVGHFESGMGPTGGAQFDYMLNGGNFEIQFAETDQRTVVTCWSLKGIRSIYAYGGYPGKVALAKYAQEFDEIDDPLTFDFRNTSVPVEEGEIAIFVNEFGCVLIKVIEVHSGHRYGSDHTSVKIKYEVRVFD